MRPALACPVPMREKFVSQFEMQEKKHKDALEKAVIKENDRVKKTQQINAEIVEKYQNQLNAIELELQNSKSAWDIKIKDEIIKEKQQIEQIYLEKERQNRTKFNHSIELLNEQMKNQDDHNIIITEDCVNNAVTLSKHKKMI